jgi:dephospho-CoA kinase
MRRVAVVTDQQPSQAPRATAVEPPIGPYHRVPVVVHRADPHAAAVAGRLIALLASRWPSTPAEHVGSSAVAGLAGKNIIDLLVAAAPADLGAITAALLALGLQFQAPAVFPASRPMLWGSLRHGPVHYRVHVHVVPASSAEVAAMRGFRDALRADRCLRRRYAALKRAIVAAGPVDPVGFTRAKHDWIVAALGQLGLASDHHPRLYDDPPARPSTPLAA